MLDVRVRRAVRLLGLDVGHRRTTLCDLLQRAGVDVVLDVGANEGQFGRRLRAWGYRGRIVSFEPVPAVYARVAAAAAADPLWEVHPLALSEADGTARINVTGATVFSSLREPAPDLVAAFPSAAVIGTEEVAVRSLDSLLPELEPLGERPFLKVDVQGAEHDVLAGAAATLERVVGVQVEMSLRRLYLGEASFGALASELEERGFTMSLIEPVAYDDHGAMLAADAVFLRAPRP